MKGRLINRYLRYLIGRDLCEIESFVIFEAMDCNVESIFKNFYREKEKEGKKIERIHDISDLLSLFVQLYRCY